MTSDTDGGGMEARYRKMLLSLTPEERVIKACAMFSTARALAVAGLRAETPDLDGVALKQALLKRFYGNDLSPEALERAMRGLEEHEAAA